METIFDHNITKAESKALTGFEDFSLSDLEGWTQRDHYGLIYRLYKFRKDDATAKKYADMIPNDVHKVFGTCYHDFAK